MSAPRYTEPKDKTNPFIYLPVGIIAVVLVSFVFASGLMRGMYVGAMTDKPAPRETKKKEVVNVKALAEPTKELITQGRQLYGLNCVSCHGPEGRGDGEKGLSLNPRPRNYHEKTGWKNGPEVRNMWKTLEHGVPGSSMSSYSLMPPEERIAIIHFIRATFVTEAPAVSPDDVAALPGPGAGGGGAMAAAADSGPRIPVELAMKRLEKPAIKPVAHVEPPAGLSHLKGAALYESNCASCHGHAGEGVAAGKVITIFPYVRLATPSLIGDRSPRVQKFDDFASFVTTTRPGAHAEHGFATLTRPQLEDLHEYVKALAREGATH